ncbi:MAG TPA: NDP-sugar synthase [Acidimicrobiia bacterium]|nr:NDP-sugar synthase [Acidimicrobiia bacterium]
MKAVVLVGGEGTRLRPLTYTTPKPLLPIANQAFLERQLSWLAQHGVDEAVLSLGYLQDAFVEHFPDGSYQGVRLQYAVEDEPLGTAGGIRYAADVAGVKDRFVVCNGDVLTNLDLTALVAFHDSRGAEATIHLARVSDPSAFGVVPTYPDGEVKAFVEKPPRGAAPTDWINAGTYVLESSVLDRIPAGLTVSIERETFPRMLDQRFRLYAVPSDAYWIDIGTPDKYLQAHRDVLAGKVGLPPAPGAREAAPGVWVQGTVDVDDRARLVAPVLLGDGARVEAGAVVSGSVIGAGGQVARDASVSRSVVLERARVGAGARVADTVVGADASLGDQATATDQTIVGPSAVVSAGTTVARGRIAVGSGAP